MPAPGLGHHLVTSFINRPMDRLKNLSSRITPPNILQRAVLKTLSHRHADLSDIPSMASVAPLAARVELHALDALDQPIEGLGPNLPGWIQAHFNPGEMERSIATQWTDVKVPGMGHPIIHYGGTDAQVMTFSLFFDAFLWAEPKEPDALARGVDKIDICHRFLEACSYERANAKEGPIDGTPPRLFFHWPNAIKLKCVMEKLVFKYLMHAPTGHILRFTADVTLKEIRNDRLTFEAARANGARRFTQDRDSGSPLPGPGVPSNFG